MKYHVHTVCTLQYYFEINIEETISCKRILKLTKKSEQKQAHMSEQTI
jgi:hypothetical protein